jgi:rhodanese-related sulfurtransferase
MIAGMIFNRRTVLALALLAPGAALAQQAAPAAISAREAYAAQQAGALVLVDIRTPSEWAQTGVPKGALRIDLASADFLSKLEAARRAHPGKRIGLICRTSSRTSRAAQALAARGWSEIVDVAGGVAGSPRGKGWFAEGLPVEP